MEPEVETSSAQSNFSHIIPRSSEYNLRQKTKPNCKYDFK